MKDERPYDLSFKDLKWDGSKYEVEGIEDLWKIVVLKGISLWLIT